MTSIVWQCDRATPTIPEAIAAARLRFTAQFGVAPTLVEVHAADLPAVPADLPERVVTRRTVARGTVWVGAQL